MVLWNFDLLWKKNCVTIPKTMKQDLNNYDYRAQIYGQKL